MLLHAGEGHVESVGEVRDRRVRTRELLENAASGGVRERGEGGIEVGLRILNHMVQYVVRAPSDARGCRRFAPNFNLCEERKWRSPCGLRHPCSSMNPCGQGDRGATASERPSVGTS